MFLKNKYCTKCGKLLQNKLGQIVMVLYEQKPYCLDCFKEMVKNGKTNRTLEEVSDAFDKIQMALEVNHLNNNKKINSYPFEIYPN